MQIKKVAVLTLALAFVAGFFAPVAKADSIQKELEKRGIDPVHHAVAKIVYTNGLLDYGLAEQKTLWPSEKAIKQLTQDMIADNSPFSDTVKIRDGISPPFAFAAMTILLNCSHKPLI